MSSAVTAPMPAAIRREACADADHRFFSRMAAVFLVVMFAGFARTYYLSPWTGAEPVSPLVHVHAIVFSAWPFFFLLQTRLVPIGRVSWHRRAGIAGSVLAVVLIVLGYVAAIEAARHGFMGRFPNEPSGFVDALAFLMLGVGDLVTFAVLFGAAFILRRRPAAHKRLMLYATLSFLPAAIFRIPLGPARIPMGFLLLLILLGSVPYHDWRTRRRIHPASAWACLFFVVSVATRVSMGNSAAWHRVAAWLIR